MLHLNISVISSSHKSRRETGLCHNYIRYRFNGIDRGFNRSEIKILVTLHIKLGCQTTFLSAWKILKIKNLAITNFYETIISLYFAVLMYRGSHNMFMQMYEL